TLGVRLVGEHASRADLGEVAGELALERAFLRAAEVNVRRRAEHVEIGAARVVFVIAHAAIARDAAIHLVRNERPELLIEVRALVEAIAPAVMAGHHRHVLQMAVTAFFADRAVVWMAGHHVFDDRLAERLGFLVVDRDVGAVRRRRHARHDDLADLVRLVLELLHRALAASADAAERGMPAEIGDVETQRQAGLEQVVGAVDLVLLAVDVDRRHYAATFDLAMPASNSDRKYFSADCRGSIAPGACAQNVLPGPSHLVICSSISRSPGLPRPSSSAIRMRTLHGNPSRHGVHQPHDSREKNSSRLRTTETMLCLSSTTVSKPVPMRDPALAMVSKSIARSRC